MEKKIIGETITLDTIPEVDGRKREEWGGKSNWVDPLLPMLGHSIKRIWEEAIETPHVSISPIHIQPIFDPDPEVYNPYVGMVVRIWAEVE